MNRIGILLLLPCLLLSCASLATRPAVVDYEQHEAREIEAFKKQYARYALPEGMDPAFEKTEITRLQKRAILRKAGGLSLELELGRRWKTPAGNRTESRYRLLGAKGRLLASAESTLSLDDLGKNDNILVVFHDPAPQSLLIHDEMCWIAKRYILLQPLGTGDTWAVKYMTLPGRPSMIPVARTSTFRGIHNGRLYFQMDDWKYAMPAEEMSEEGNLEFGIG